MLERKLSEVVALVSSLSPAPSSQQLLVQHLSRLSKDKLTSLCAIALFAHHPGGSNDLLLSSPDSEAGSSPDDSCPYPRIVRERPAAVFGTSECGSVADECSPVTEQVAWMDELLACCRPA